METKIEWLVNVKCAVYSITVKGPSTCHDAQQQKCYDWMRFVTPRHEWLIILEKNQFYDVTKKA